MFQFYIQLQTVVYFWVLKDLHLKKFENDVSFMVKLPRPLLKCSISEIIDSLKLLGTNFRLHGKITLRKLRFIFSYFLI
jgi:hypothetical protein